jgi:hypothetical protein
MKLLTEEYSQRLHQSASLSDFFTVVGFIIVMLLAGSSSLFAGEENKQEFVTFRNDSFRFEVTAPKSWSFSRIVQQDPYEEMKSGSYSTSISGGDEQNNPENWNGFKLTSTDTSGNRQPFLVIYGHKVGDQKPEEFATLFKRTLTQFSGKGVKADWELSVGDANGFDCTYGLVAKVRYTALYRDGIRVVIMYFFPSSDPTDFDKYAPDVDRIIRSLEIK